jgi:putative iron-regulated protein
MRSPSLPSLFSLFFITLLVAVIWGCKDAPTNPDQKKKEDSLQLADSIRVANSLAWKADSTAFRAEVLCDLVQNVIMPTLKDFVDKAATLSNAAVTLKTYKTAQFLVDARNMWLDAREPWERSEAFLFGPVRKQQLDAAINSWPVDLITIDSMLASNDRFTTEYFAASEGTVKGMHAIEHLLWGDDGNKQLGQFTAREYEFLAAAAAELQRSAQILLHGWATSWIGGGDYGRHLCYAGTQGSLYTSQHAALADIVNASANILVELSDAKMGIPFAQRTDEFEESRFSGNTLSDFKSNVLGVESIYTGTYGSRSGRGLRDLVVVLDPALDARIREQIQAAMVRIDGITPSFKEAIINNRNSIQTARFAITELSVLYSKDMMKLFDLD